jgi:hypothetical protein
MEVVVLTVAEYMEGRRKSIDRYVEGEHRWYGDLSTQLPSLSMYNSPLPWYLKRDTTIDKMEGGVSN